MKKLLFLSICYIFFTCGPKEVIQEPDIIRQDLFIAGKQGYHRYRIPGLAVTKNGVILAYCAARKGKGGDWDEIDVAMRRSLDGGDTWTTMEIIADVDTVPTDNPMAIIDYKTGSVHFLYQSNYEKLYYMRSENDGGSFTEPKEITDVIAKFKAHYPWVVQAPGPGHGIQISNGRLVVPFWLSNGGAKEFGPNHRGHRPSIVVAVYSDDHGKTWEAGDVVVWNNEVTVVPNETSLVQLKDGRVMFYIRNESPNYRRLISTSEDGATNWSEPYYEDAFFEPICFGSMTRVSMKPYQTKNRILFANPDSRNNPRARGRTKGYFDYSAPGRRRENLTLMMSYDEGQTWPVKKVMESGISGYSDLGILPDGQIICMYESGGMKGISTQTAALTFAKFNVEWLTDGEDHLSSSDKPFAQTYLNQ